MNTVIEEITQIVSEAFKSLGYDEALGKVTVSNRPDLCEFQCNGAMAGAKKYKKNPFDIAKEVVSTIENKNIFKKIEVVKPGFINITLSDKKIIEKINGIMKAPSELFHKTDKEGTIVIDYGGANVAKPLHVGHLRAAIIGESVKRLCKVLGYNTIGDIHLGDWGLQIGLIITEYAERNPESKYMDENYLGPYEPLDITMEYLNEIYPLASSKSKQDEEYMKKAHKATFELQNKRPGYYAFWKEVMRISVAELKMSYEKLNVFFELWYGESDSDKYIPAMIDDLTKKGFAHESEGALVVDVEEEGDTSPMPPMIIRKTDGSVMYATTDLATIIQRVQDYNPLAIIYIVDNRQGFHFKQLFRAARKTGIVDDKIILTFDGFGTMNGSDGKPYKTRSGGVMRLNDLINVVDVAALKKMRESKNSNDLSEEEEREIALKVGVAALKFGDLINHRSKDYIFDLDKFLSFEGKTGPYILYTMVRLKAILRKANVKTKDITAIYSEVEHDILIKILNTNNVLWQAFYDRAPSVICENAYSLAALANRFYYETKILGEEDELKRMTRLSLCKLMLDVLEMHTNILAIDVPDKM